VTRARFFVFAASTLLALFVWLTQIHPGSSSGASQPAVPPLSEVVAKVRDGVVQVETPCSGYEKSGTGFLVGPQLVATVLHVVNGADTVSLWQDGQEIGTGAVVGRDYAHDLALVQTGRPLPGHVFALASEPAAPGLAVGALGFTRGRDSPRETQGTVVGGDLTIVVRGLERPGLVEVQMPFDHGDSGGPVFDLRDGSVIGLIDIVSESESGIGLAIDAQIAGPLFTGWAAAPHPIQGSSC